MPLDQPPAAPPAVAQPFDLAQVATGRPGMDLHVVRPRCSPGKAGEIVVCASDQEKERLRPLPDDYAVTDGPGKAEVDVGGGVSLNVHAESAAMPNGMTGSRLMLGGKLKF